MRIKDLLAGKGTEVATLLPTATVAEVISALAERGIGAVVISTDGAAIDGIVSERDVARGLHESGADLLSALATSIMTADVRTCTLDADVVELARLMTDHRIRHVPVVKDDRLAGIVSIGDVVKARIGELENEREHLVGYITQ